MSGRETISVDPITRIEGHLKVEVVADNGEVKEARCSGQLFRGFELMLLNRDPRDASLLSQRVCGVCPVAHAMASALCLDACFGIDGRVPDNGRVMRNLVLGANFLQSHILHFYHLAALDFVDVTAGADYEGADDRLGSLRDFIKRGELAPFMPRYEGDYRLSKEANQQAASHYVQALEARRAAHEMLSVFGGKMPHQVGIVVGGCTETPTADKIAAFLSRLEMLRRFIEGIYIPDVLTVAEAYGDYFEIGGGVKRWLSYGGLELETEETNLVARERFFPSGRVGADLKPAALDVGRIAEHVRHSWYADESSGRHPSKGETVPAPGKESGYSWIKAPRYEGEPYEVGPLARLLVAYARGDRGARGEVEGVLSRLDAKPEALFSVLGRHAARALEAKRVAEAMVGWAMELRPGEPVCEWREPPEAGRGMGVTEAPRGSVGHWAEIEGGKLVRYQLVVPTTWNASPQDDEGKPGPMEQALVGTRIRDAENPFEVVRIVRSFDPCLACSVHMLTPKGQELARCRVL
ncbi:MAG: nickel-dependent hydrogenase large subunit [Armatimonadota bacterium]|nr:MAG: nickel-dependent hydrogenase large subunit [Armatimonadota bacterium]